MSFFFIPPSRLLLKGKTQKTGSLVSVVFRTDCTSEVLKVETFGGSCQSHGPSMRNAPLSAVSRAQKQRPIVPTEATKAWRWEASLWGGRGGLQLEMLGETAKKPFSALASFKIVKLKNRAVDTVSSSFPSHRNDFDFFVPMSRIFWCHFTA